MRLTLFLSFSLAALCSAVPARAVYDVSPRLDTSLGRLDTYGYDDAGDTSGGNPIYLTPNENRVFAYFLGDFDDPYFDTDPGIHGLSSTSGYTPSGLPQGSYISFDVVNELQYWNGAGSVSFGNVPAAESLKLFLNQTPFSVTIGSGAGLEPGFPVQNIDALGGMHKHLWTELQAGSNSTPADGVYLFEMRLKLLQSDAQTPYPGVAPSLPFFVLFDNNESLATYMAAQNWVQANLVPFGDFNRDGTTTAADVSAMMAALSDLNTYKTANQLTDFELQAFGDVNQDGVIDDRDVQALITYLANEGTGDTGLGSLSVVPEPSGWQLAIIGLIVLGGWGLTGRIG